MFDLLESRIRGSLHFKESMSKHTSFGIGGPADVLVVPKDIGDVIELVNFARESSVPLYVIGNGTKLLVGDGGIRGIVVKIADTLDHLSVCGDQVVAGAGVSLARIVEITRKEGLSGFEFAAGIPGTLGGAIAMNAGTCYGSMSDLVANVKVIDSKKGQLRSISRTECDFAYRRSVFQDDLKIIISATLSLCSGKIEDIVRTAKTLMAKRVNSQPLDKPNAGSIFRNPTEVAAGKLIDSVGLKGMRIGGAQISEKHANFIVNLGNARADDVYVLVKLAQKEVKSKYGIDLIPELRIIGEFKSPNHF